MYIQTYFRILHIDYLLLSGALQEAIRKDEDEEPQSEAESLSSSLSSPLKRPPGTNGSPFCSPTKAVRKRKRKAEDPGRAFHHTFVMKLFDRSVDLAQFGGTSNYPLYPVCRAWMRNEPSNTSQAPVPRSPSPQMPSDGEDDMVNETLELLGPLRPIFLGQQFAKARTLDRGEVTPTSPTSYNLHWQRTGSGPRSE